MSRTLIVTNDFPPRPGGIQSFVHDLAVRLPAGSVVVYASDLAGRARSSTPSSRSRWSASTTSRAAADPAVARRARGDRPRARLRHRSGSARPRRSACSPPAAAPAGVSRAVALTHGHEAGWAALPGARQLLRRIGRGADVVTYLGEYTRTRLARALRRPDRPGAAGARRGRDAFRPGRRRRRGPRAARAGRPAGRRLRVPAGAAQGPGHADPGAAGDPAPGPGRRAAARRRRPVPVRRWSGWPREPGVGDDVVFTGAVPWAELPAHYAAGDVFAMPCRTRRGGLDVEGLGIVYLEASATGLPVVAGDSGGAPDAVLRRRDRLRRRRPRRAPRVADRVADAAGRPGRWRRAMGAAGRAWVEREWRWDTQARAASPRCWRRPRSGAGSWSRTAEVRSGGQPARPNSALCASLGAVHAAGLGRRSRRSRSLEAPVGAGERVHAVSAASRLPPGHGQATVRLSATHRRRPAAGCAGRAGDACRMTLPGGGAAGRRARGRRQPRNAPRRPPRMAPYQRP